MKILLAASGIVASRNAWLQTLQQLALDGIHDVTLFEFGSEQSDCAGVGDLVSSRELWSITNVRKASPSRTTVQSYADFIRSPGYTSFRYLSIKLLNRLDLTGTFRLLDREVAVQSATVAMFDALERIRPDLVVFPLVPHEFLPFILSRSAQWLGIKRLYFSPSALAPAMRVHADWDLSSWEESRALESSEASMSVLSSVSQAVTNLSRGNPPQYMANQRSRDESARRKISKIRSVKQSLASLISERFPGSVGFTGHAAVSPFLRRLSGLLLTRSLQESLRKRIWALGETTPPAHEYAIFALGYEPELTTLPLGMPIEYQGDAIIIARALLPERTRLWVKEHYSQQSSALRGFAGRSPDFYDSIEALPNTSFAHADIALTPFISSAVCVFTLTGSVAIEAVLSGTPVGYFGSPWWSGMPGTLRIQPETTQTEIQAVKIPSRDDLIAFLNKKHTTKMVPGFGPESWSFAERRFGALPESIVREETEGIMTLIDHFARETETPADTP